MSEAARRPPKAGGPLIYRQTPWTRVAHWLWAVALFFLLLSGLQIFMARPDLYIGQQSGFAFDNAFLSISAEAAEDGGIKGVTDLFGWRFDTTGWLGVVEVGGVMQPQTFPGWMIIPSFRDLATGRVVHFFFAWILAGALLLWLVAGLVTRHIQRDLGMTRADLRNFRREVADHAKLRFDHGPGYNAVQKLSYILVMFLALPLMMATGLAMSPAMDAWAPWLLDLFGGRQTARTIHFFGMLALVLFFVVHIVLILIVGPLNTMRAMITGWYRIRAREIDPREAGLQETGSGDRP